MTEVIHVRDARPGDVYVGRPNSRVPTGVVLLTELGNPYHLLPDSDRAGVIAQYEQRLMQSPHLLRLLPKLRGKRLACWCRPAACHADVIEAFLRHNTDDELLRLADEVGRIGAPGEGEERE